MLQGVESHKGDDLFELAKAKRVIIYPAHVVDQIIEIGLELQQMPKTKLDDIFTAA